MTHVAISTPPSKANVTAIQQLPNGGRGACVVHGRSNNRKARRQMTLALERLGLPHRVAQTLHWSTAAPKSAAAPEPVRDQVEPELVGVG